MDDFIFFYPNEICCVLTSQVCCSGHTLSEANLISVTSSASRETDLHHGAVSDTVLHLALEERVPHSGFIEANIKVTYLVINNNNSIK